MASTTKKPWTAKHKREAIRRTFELCASSPHTDKVLDVAGAASWGAQCERRLRDNLSALGLDHAGIERAVERVRGLAEGRMVREETWHVRMLAGNLSCAMEEKSARDMWRHAVTTQGVVVRVTRIRRASTPAPTGDR